MKSIGHLRNQILAVSVATVLVYAIGVAIPTLTATPAFATHYDNKDDKSYDNKDDKSYDNKNYDYKSQFLNDVEQCFPDNGNHGEQFSDDVKECIYDVIAAYFDGGTNNNSNNDDSSSTDSTSTSTSTSNGNPNSNDDNDDSSTDSTSASTTTSNGNRLGMGNGIGSLLSS